jgi:hypothetical protein
MDATPPLLHAPPPRPTFAIVTGIGNSDWVHAGLDGKLDRFSAQFTVGTLGMAQTLNLSGRFHPWKSGAFVEAGTSWIRLSSQSPETPPTSDLLAFVGLGWRFEVGPFVSMLSVGPNPVAASTDTLFGQASVSLPRLSAEIGYAF